METQLLLTRLKSEISQLHCEIFSHSSSYRLPAPAFKEQKQGLKATAKPHRNSVCPAQRGGEGALSVGHADIHLPSLGMAPPGWCPTLSQVGLGLCDLNTWPQQQTQTLSEDNKGKQLKLTQSCFWTIQGWNCAPSHLPLLPKGHSAPADPMDTPCAPLPHPGDATG